VETLRFLMVSTFYPPHHLGGDAVHVQYLAEALASRGHEVHVEYSPSAFGVKRPLSAPQVAATQGRVHMHPMSSSSKILSPIAAYLLGQSRAVTRFHERLVREARPDVVHLHNISLLGLGVQQSVEGRPIVYTAHDYWFRCPRSDWMKRGRAPCEAPTCVSCMVLSRRIPPPWRRADVANRMDHVQCVIAPSRFMKRAAQASFGCPVIHIPNFAPDANPSGEVAPGSPYFLYAGVFEAHKGIPELAQAASAYRGPKRIVLVGRGSEEPRLRNLAAQQGSPLEVRPWADPPELASMYRDAAAFLMPSRCLENAPLAAIEALAWGVPLLTTSRGGVPELLHEGAAGFAFEPNPAGIVNALHAFDTIVDPSALRKGARDTYERHHRPETYLNRYLSLVDRLASGEAQGLEAVEPDEGPTAIPELAKEA
jgi:glycosyltransferase involved in cell wall biosynthesis